MDAAGSRWYRSARFPKKGDGIAPQGSRPTGSRPPVERSLES
jgi:hypothetical protein